MFVVLSAALAASPTHAQMEATSYSPLAERQHDDAGTVKVSSATIGGVSCFKAEATTSDVDGKTLLGVVADPVGAKRWSTAGITKAELLSKSGNSLSYYQYLDVPGWTMSSDRFWFLDSTIADNGTVRSLKWNRMKQGGPHQARYEAFKAENSNAVEPPINVGSWTFTDSGLGTQIRYLICTDSGGSIPYAIQNAATRKTLPDTVGDAVREGRKRLGK